MNHDQCAHLIKRMIHHVEADTSDEAESTLIEPASAFLDQERWQLERQRLFLDTPQVIAFAGEVSEPGSFVTAEVMSIPIVVTRAEDGVLRAFINACGHKGARIAAGNGSKRRMTCSFHGWSYSLDGCLAGRPKASAFDKGGPGESLQALPVSDRGGLIVVGLKADMPQQTVDHFLDDISPELTGFGFDTLRSVETRRYKVDANWKLVVGLSHESYHFATLHRDSLSPLMTSHAVVDTFGQHSRWGFSLKGICELKNKPEDQWPSRFPGAINHTIFPGTVIVVNSEDAQIIRSEPGDTPGSSVVYYSGGCANPDNMQQSLESYDFGGTIFNNEDLPIAVECQRGLAAGLPSIVIGRNEPIVQFWHKLWQAALEVE